MLNRDDYYFDVLSHGGECNPSMRENMCDSSYDTIIMLKCEMVCASLSCNNDSIRPV